MRHALLAAAVVLLGGTAQAEIRPSFHLAGAAKAAASLVVVEDGKVVEVWAGDAKVGAPYGPESKRSSIKVVYGFPPLRGQDDALIDQELAKKGLKRVASVSGRRMLYFVLPEPPQHGYAQMMSRDPAYTTVWLEEGQAFAIQQWINPGPANMQSLDMKETELKHAILDVREVDAKVRAINKEEDRTERARKLVSLLRSGNHLWNDEVKQSIRQCGKAAWPAIEAMLSKDEHLPLHGQLLHLAHGLARSEAQPLFEKILATEHDYFRRLDAAGEKYDRLQPPHLYHEQRRSAAQWAIDSK